MIKKICAYVALVGMIISANGGVATAHVTVKPAEVATAAFQVFTTSVPTELDQPTIKVRVVMPEGLGHVTPTVKPGWTIDTIESGEGEDTVVDEIIWSGGGIPVGQRDEFSFSAQAPEAETTLQWKAYQTYADGTEVAWDQAPSKDGHGDSAVKPLSETSVVDDLVASGVSQTDNTSNTGSNNMTTVALALSVVALIISAYSLSQSRSQKPAKTKK